MVLKFNQSKFIMKSSTNNYRIFSIVLIACLTLSYTKPAFAGFSFFGMSAGEDSAILSSILAEMGVQIENLTQVIKLTTELKDDISFVKGAIATTDDAINGKWDVLGDQLLDELVNDDTNIKTIYSNASDIINNRVAKNSKFHKLVNVGMNRLMIEAFGVYPNNNKGDQYALVDHQIIALDKIADTMIAHQQSAIERIKNASHACETGNVADCQKAGIRMNIETVKSLEDIKRLQAEQIKLMDKEIAVKNDERKAAERIRLQEKEDVAKAAERLLNKQDYLIFHDDQR